MSTATPRDRHVCSYVCTSHSCAGRLRLTTVIGIHSALLLCVGQAEPHPTVDKHLYNRPRLCVCMWSSHSHLTSRIFGPGCMAGQQALLHALMCLLLQGQGCNSC